MKIWGITDVGLVRRENQDAYAVESRNGFDICVVCDGMGGAAAGKLASEIAVRAYREALGETLREGMDLDAVQAAMAAAASQANRAIREEAARKPEYAGMGTTLVGGICVDDRVILANVGDSRAYLIDGDKIAQMSADHSLVAEMVRSGRLTKAEAKTYPGRNLITRAVGVDSSVEADVYEIKMHEGQTLLLCSDGLSGPVTDAEIAAAVSQAPTMEQACTQLIELACKAGGNDNITVVLYTK